jgi:RNA polymerase sigma-70 factor, ECF subfamily
VASALSSPRHSPELADAPLVDRLRDGDEHAFATLLDRYQAPMLRIAMSHVGSRAVAEEVVQETWLGVLAGIDGFEARSSLKTWIFRILVYRSITRARREGRSVPMSALDRDEPAVDPSRFIDEPGPLHGHWASAPASWNGVPEQRLLGRETRDHLARAIGTLPARQQQVVALRDVEGWSAAEVCAALDLSEANQRVLLHRARAKLRRELAAYLGADGA